MPHALYSATVETAQWFTLDVPADTFPADSEDDFSANELAFIAVLRARAAAWPVAPFRIQSYFGRPDASPVLLTILVIDGYGYSAHYDGTTVRGDAPHGDPNFPLPDSPTRWGMTPAAGPVEELAAHTADWYESLLRHYGLFDNPG